MIYRFNKTVLDTDKLELVHDGTLATIEPQVFALVVHLIENKDRVVSKDELIDVVWDGRIVSDTTLSSRINAARRALGDTGKDQIVIRTYARRGFRFVAELDMARLEASIDEDHVPPLTTGGPAIAVLPDKPSIVVLPFDNISGDREQDYFADGLTEDIITDISRFERLFVIARNTAFTYKGEKIDVPRVAKELGVHFVLEGSVRKAGDRVRITAQLIDGLNGRHVWAERYDGKLEDVFELQEDVTHQVVGAVAPQIDLAELDRHMRGERRFDEAHDLAWRAYADFRQGLTSGDLPLIEEAIDLAKRALALNAKCGIAYTALTFAYSMQNLYRWGPDPIGAADRALGAAEAAMAAMPQSDTALFCLGLARSRKGQFEQAARDLSRACELNSNDAFARHILAWCEASLGDTVLARGHAEEALRLSPKDPFIGISYLSLAMAAFVERDHDSFVDWAQKAIQAQPVAPIRRAMMIAYAAETGDADLLKTHLDALTGFSPDFIASLFRGENRLFAKQQHMDLLLTGLSKALDSSKPPTEV